MANGVLLFGDDANILGMHVVSKEKAPPGPCVSCQDMSAWAESHSATQECMLLAAYHICSSDLCCFCMSDPTLVHLCLASALHCRPPARC